MGNDVVACEADGHLGRRLRACHKGCSNGACDESCQDDNTKLYGRKLENRAIVTSGMAAPKAAAKLLNLLNMRISS